MGPFHGYPAPLFTGQGLGSPFSREMRPRRVLCLAALIVAMGATDLLCTLAYLRGAGMIELNPLARYLIQVGGAGSLACFKGLTLMVSAGLLCRIRQRRQAEFAAWVCAAIMVALTIRWAHYNAGIAEITPYITDAFARDASWVRLPD